ncbi:unnamed protein product [Anisakis simplex]|uniref:Uncharacterized protein n=1 Tax=Anisakis simplex TaxID=6269 RepID=A0A0M3JH12_ANISI|nr:unnamed protein product [Anisakis simplex]
MPGTAEHGRIIAAELTPIETSPYQCMDLRCLCIYLKGEYYEVFSKIMIFRVEKENRQLL